MTPSSPSREARPHLEGACNDDESDADVSALIDITRCFSTLIMLTKNSSANDQDSVGVGFDRRVVLYAALKEGRIFMEQFIKTTKVLFPLFVLSLILSQGLHRLFASQQQLVINMLNALQVNCLPTSLPPTSPYASHIYPPKPFFHRNQLANCNLWPLMGRRSGSITFSLLLNNELSETKC
jgi:hypothetical protein